MTILSNMAGQLLLKRAAMVVGSSGGPVYRPFLSVWFMLGVACLGLSSVLWVTVLKKLPLTVAHPITGIVFILVPILSHVLWGEPLPPARIAGIGIVIAGICLVARAE
jgi:multidrug transporter EmrE-like cation transporter